MISSLFWCQFLYVFSSFACLAIFIMINVAQLQELLIRTFSFLYHLVALVIFILARGQDHSSDCVIS